MKAEDVFQFLKEQIKECVREVIREENRSTHSQTKQMPDDEYLSRKQAAKFLAVSTVTLDRYKNEGLIESTERIGKRVRFLKSELVGALSKKENKRQKK